ncbi:hypothetical protein BAY59_27095 [Prauserella coralliicola]|nr:hypothetical protein BAY59_27095 [Prauserella coralliicola]
MQIPEFMSPDHVAQMNRLLADSVAVKEAAAAFGGTHSLTYRLDGAPSGVEYWTFEISPTGARFLLGPPATTPDATVSVDWTTMMRSARAEREGREVPAPDAQVSGDAAMMARLQEVVEIARTIATVDSRIPEV